MNDFLITDFEFANKPKKEQEEIVVKTKEIQQEVEKRKKEDYCVNFDGPGIFCSVDFKRKQIFIDCLETPHFYLKFPILKGQDERNRLFRLLLRLLPAFNWFFEEENDGGEDPVYTLDGFIFNHEESSIKCFWDRSLVLTQEQERNLMYYILFKGIIKSRRKREKEKEIDIKEKEIEKLKEIQNNQNNQNDLIKHRIRNEIERQLNYNEIREDLRLKDYC